MKEAVSANGKTVHPMLDWDETTGQQRDESPRTCVLTPPPPLFAGHITNIICSPSLPPSYDSPHVPFWTAMC